MTEANQLTNNNAIYKKLATIQGKIKELTRGKENKFQKYFYFTEYQAIKELKPLLDAEKISVVFNDDPEKYKREMIGKDHILEYLKHAIISDGENIITFDFWAMGQDTDISKAKGKAETYAIKYFLTKFFMIPIADEIDPDQLGEEKKDKKGGELKTDNGETAEQIKARHANKATAEQFLKKHDWPSNQTQKPTEIKK